MSDLDVHLDAIAAGNLAAFTEWLSAAERPLRMSLRSFAASVDTEAVLQETLLRAWQVAPRVARDGRPNALLRLALQMGHNLAISEVRKTRPRSEAPEDEVERAIDRDAVAQQAAPPDPFLREAIAECHERLPEKPRLALAQRIASAGLQVDAELAEHLGMRLNTFLQNVTRARKMLVDCLASKGIQVDVGTPAGGAP